ncbi:hypothetical protein BZA05DRAFT_472108 [Tricharina praecox]|uniref:uncharacterized protein n=1 Tax=Tricharina praecox TaxID=43433 RepID=UPI00221E4E2B|nr:uncharacterized protein BZA05DRAFT_472108 [Tricharina praecox]KAI5855203.1 hypothetical protein BZA05DRAFT_472108 [Tricharina praecox]
MSLVGAAIFCTSTWTDWGLKVEPTTIEVVILRVNAKPYTTPRQPSRSSSYNLAILSVLSIHFHNDHRPTNMTPQSAARSEAAPGALLRRQGKRCYREGRYADAVTNYLSAINLDPADVAARRCLSSARFENGDYQGCLATIKDTLPLETDEKNKVGLRIRQAKCYFHLNRFPEARDLLDCYSGGSQDALNIKKTVDNGKKPYTAAVKKAVVAEMVEMPRFRPSLHAGLNIYFPRNHNHPVAGIKVEELHARAKAKSPLDISLFYGGIGDSRQVFQQIHHIYGYYKDRKDEPATQKTSTDKFFFTAMDISAHTMALNLIIYRLLFDLTMISQRFLDAKARMKEKSMILSTIWYALACDIMPPYIFARLTSVMKSLYEETRDNFGIPWMRTNKKTVDAIRSVLSYWLGDAMTLRERLDYDVKYAQTRLSWTKRAEYLNNPVMKDMASLKPEWNQYEASMLVYPPPILQLVEEPELAALVKENNGKRVHLRQNAFKEYAQKNWEVNITLLQEPDWYNKWGYTWKNTTDVVETITKFYIGASPKHLMISLADVLRERPVPPIEVEPQLIEMCMPIFSQCAEVLAELHFTIELVVDEVLHHLDTVRYKTDGRSDFPTQYDCIFLGNIGDCSGGHLATALHALPVLKPDTLDAISFTQINILLNAACFSEGLPRALAEYLCVPSVQVASSMLGIDRVESPDSEAHDANIPKLYRWVRLSDPDRWTLSTRKPFPPKASFTRWFTQMFFKLALPVPRAMADGMTRINQPLTLSSFIRLSIFLVKDRGIPPHWVANAIDSLLSGSVWTAARFTTTAPLAIREVSYLLPGAEPPSLENYNLDAFIPEFRALVIRHQPILPYNLSFSLPPRSALEKYSLVFNIIDTTVGPSTEMLSVAFVAPDQSPHDLTQLWNYCACGTGTYGKILLFGNLGWKLEGGRQGAFRFVCRAALWMEKETMQMMQAQNWMSLVVRTDTYMIVSAPVKAVEAHYV